MKCNYCGKELRDNDEFVVLIVNLRDVKRTITVCKRCFERIFFKIDNIYKLNRR